MNKKKKTINMATGSNVITDWMYMTSSEITVLNIKEILKDEYAVDVWNEAGVLEIELEGGSMDFEQSSRLSFKDETADDYVKKNSIKSLFFVSFKSDIENNAREIMKKLATELGGEFLADTDDLMPKITKD